MYLRLICVYCVGELSIYMVMFWVYFELFYGLNFLIDSKLVVVYIGDISI